MNDRTFVGATAANRLRGRDSLSQTDAVHAYRTAKGENEKSPEPGGDIAPQELLEGQHRNGARSKRHDDDREYLSAWR